MSKKIIPKKKNTFSPFVQKLEEQRKFLNDFFTRKNNETSSKKTPTREEIINAAWRAENPINQGLQKDGTYETYPDPNGEDLNAGAGLLVGVTIPKKKIYTKKELDDSAYQYGLRSLKAIGDAYNRVKGNSNMRTPWDTVSVSPKLLMLDTRYQNGNLNPNKWPNLYQAIADGDYAKALRESRSTYKKEGVIHYDNDRVRRRAEIFFPNQFEVTFKKDSPEFPIVKRK